MALNLYQETPEKEQEWWSPSIYGNLVEGYEAPKYAKRYDQFSNLGFQDISERLYQFAPNVDWNPYINAETNFQGQQYGGMWRDRSATRTAFNSTVQRALAAGALDANLAKQMSYTPAQIQEELQNIQRRQSMNSYGDELNPTTGFAAVLSAGALAGALAGTSAAGAGTTAAGTGAGAGTAAGVGAAEGLGLSSIWGSSLPYGAVELGIGGTTGLGLGGAGAFDAGGWGAAESMGLGSGYASPALAGGTGVDMTGFMSDYNPFGFANAADVPSYGSLSGYTPGDFTLSQLPGGGLSQYGGLGGMVDLGGVGGVSGAGLSDPSLWQTLTQKLTQSVGEQAAKSVLGRVFNGTATTDDYMRLLGNLGAAGLGAYGANQQANSLQSLARDYMNLGAPSRSRFEASMTPGFDPNSIPGYAGALDTASKAILARLSATGGNPFGSPGAMIDANKAIVSGTALPAINEYQRLNLAAGGQANLNAAVPSLQQQAIGQEGNVLNAFGYGLNQLTNPTQPMLNVNDIAKAFGLTGLA